MLRNYVKVLKEICLMNGIKMNDPIMYWALMRYNRKTGITEMTDRDISINLFDEWRVGVDT